MKNCLKEDCSTCKDPDFSECEDFRRTLEDIERMGKLQDLSKEILKD